VQGGTGASHIAPGTGFAASYQNAKGQATPPPAGEIENPNPKPGTNNNYIQDGYGSSTTPNAGGSYPECADPAQPGVSAIDHYLAALPYQTFKNCQPGRYYLLDNYNAGYNLDGTVNTAPYTVPPQKSDYRARSPRSGQPGNVDVHRLFGTFDESGGYYDSGYIQPVSFFGDGPSGPRSEPDDAIRFGRPDFATPRMATHAMRLGISARRPSATRIARQMRSGRPRRFRSRTDGRPAP
jgi:hypothetical protein